VAEQADGGAKPAPKTSSSVSGTRSASRPAARQVAERSPLLTPRWGFARK
jgi:hypothetical protein